MKQRITYLLPADTGIDPDSIKVAPDHINFTGNDKAAIEKRLTVGLSELPRELTSLFEHVHELHVRWSSQTYHKPVSPLISRLPPGLHVFFTPQRSHSDLDICPTLRKVFGGVTEKDNLKCHSVAESFSSPQGSTERFTSSSAYQYYQPLSNLRGLQAMLRDHPWCTDSDCAPEVDLLDSVDSVDIDFDIISHAVTFTTYHHPAHAKGASRGQAVGGIVRKVRASDSVEVGVLQGEKPDEDEPESLKLGGYLTVVGEDDHPGATLFSFPSRHHTLAASSRTSFEASFQQPTGLHPKLDIVMPRKHLSPPAETCALHAYLTLSSALFIDRFQLSDALFLGSQNLVALRTLSGEDDLEAPDWVIKRWGSAALLELAHPPSTLTAQNDNWTVTIPTHLRYLSSNASSPSDEPGQATLDVPWPVVFWACEAQEGLKMSVNPFDRVNLGYNGLFGPKTMFFHVPPALPEGGELVKRLSVPVLEPKNAAWVQIGTLVAVLAGFGWVCWRLMKGVGTVPKKTGKIE